MMSEKRKQSSRVPTAHVSVANIRCQYQCGEIGTQVNKFEQVSSDNHHMSVAGGGGGSCPGLMCRGVPYHVTYPMKHVMYLSPHKQKDRQL